MKGNYTEPRICTMVGRDPENPSSRVRSDRYKQMIEMGDDVSNTLTSVQKDNLVAEPQILTPKRTDFGKQVRKQYEAGELDMSRHDMTELEPRKDGISNTLTSVQKDNLVAEPLIIDDYNQRIPQDQDVIGTVTTQFGNPAPRHGYKIAEPLQIKQATKQGYIEIPPGSVFDASYPDSQTRRGRVQDGGQTSPTLMASGEAPCYYEGVQMVQRQHGFNKGNTHEVSPTVTSSAFQDNNFVEEWKTVVGSKQENSFLGDVNGECPCVTSACGAGGGMTPMVTDASLEQARTDDFREQVRGHQPLHYRIRKLTPRECFRLMGVTEENIDKIQQSGVSQSQQYKMAGNSIVVDCLFHLFRKMFTETENENNQMLLF